MQKFDKKKKSSKIWPGRKHDKGDIPTKICSNWMSSSHFIMGQVKFCPASVA